MRVETLAYRPDRGWSRPFPKLDSSRTLVLVFGARELADEAAFAQIVEAFPSSIIIGCSTAGEIHDVAIADGSLSVAIAQFERTTLKRATTIVEPGGSFAAGTEIARALVRPELRAILVLSDGVNVNGSDLVRGMNSLVEQSVVVTGGLAGDGSHFRQTWVVGDARPTDKIVAAVGLYGEHVQVGHGSRGGWEIFGPERVVTRSSGNVLYELDGERALALYKRYLGDRAAGLPATALLFPLALIHREEETALVRTVLSVNEPEQSMTFAGDIPQGNCVQLMRANLERLIDGAEDAASVATNGVSGAPKGDVLAIAISCVGRRLVLGERAEEEIEAAKRALPSECHLIGFYSYGEISPYAAGRCDLHNQTMTLTTISETSS